jgi:cyclophilin family peptidyl-prolyl cis-trans isomerase
MANLGQKNDNGSQFFLTLEEMPELTGRNTMFGRIEGETIYNLMKMAEADLVDGMERPMYPTKITRADIVLNPFEDMTKRVTEAPRTAPAKEISAKRKPKRKRYEVALGPKHTSTINTANNLGMLYADQGKLVEAEAMYTRAVQGKEEALGPKHKSTLDTVHNLGNLHADQGKLADGEADVHSGTTRIRRDPWSESWI